MNRLYNIGLLFVCFIIVSCEAEIEVPVKFPDTFAVLNASLSKDSIITASISHTLNTISQDISTSGSYPFINNAKINVFINDISQGLMIRDELPGQYCLPGCYPSPGDKIRLEVETEEFENMSAEVCIPQAPVILSVDTQMLKSSYGDLGVVDVRLRFRKPDNKNNYYMLLITESSNPVFTTHNEDLLFEELQPYYFTNSPYYGYHPSFIFNDRTIYSDEYTLKFTINNVAHSYYSDSLSITNICHIHLYSISESYYLYCRSKMLQSKQKEDPFGSVGLREPIPTYTNIQNGYGLLSAKEVAIYEIRISPAEMITKCQPLYSCF